jgi:hypothetical protein
MVRPERFGDELKLNPSLARKETAPEVEIGVCLALKELVLNSTLEEEEVIETTLPLARVWILLFDPMKTPLSPVWSRWFSDTPNAVAAVLLPVASNRISPDRAKTEVSAIAIPSGAMVPVTLLDAQLSPMR